MVPKIIDTEITLREQANLLNLTHDSIFVRDMQNIITYWNRGAEEFYGWTAAEVVGKVTIHQLLQTVFPAPLDEIDAELLRTGHWEGELVHTKADGAKAVVASRWSLQRGEQQRPQAILELNNDITERKRAETAIREQANLLNLTHDSIFVRDMQNIITYWNRGAEEFYGWTAAEVVGKVTTHQLLQTVFPAPLDEIDAELLRTGHWEGELMHTKADGAKAVVASRWSLQRGEQQRPQATLELNNDITSRRQVQEALREAQEDLARVNRVMLLNELTASIAHEVNQPLAAIASSASAATRWLATAPPHLDEATTALVRIVRDSLRAGEIISRVGALVKKEAPQEDLLDINETILKVIAMSDDVLQRNNVILRTGLSSGLPVVTADRIQVLQVILNLITNAVEAMNAQAGGPRELTVNSGWDDETELFVEVRDTGTGLDPAHLDRLFESFRTTKPGGMGLGLAISRSIVTAHGGRIWAASNQPCGAVFRFTLPIRHDIP